MTWFEAYLLWKLDAFSALFGIPAIVSGTLIIVFSFVYACNRGDVNAFSEGSRLHQEAKTLVDLAKKMLKLCVPIFVVSALFIAVIPTTETLLKIIATKKGVDAIQSGTAQNYLSEADKAITNGLKVLNQEIERKLDKKQEAK